MKYCTLIDDKELDHHNFYVTYQIYVIRTQVPKNAYCCRLAAKLYMYKAGNIYFLNSVVILFPIYQIAPRGRGVGSPARQPLTSIHPFVVVTLWILRGCGAFQWL